MAYRTWLIAPACGGFRIVGPERGTAVFKQNTVIFMINAHTVIKDKNNVAVKKVKVGFQSVIIPAEFCVFCGFLDQPFF